MKFQITLSRFIDYIAMYLRCFVTSALHRHFTSRTNLLNRGVIICIIGRNSSFITIATFYLAGSLARLVFTSVSIEAERYGPRFFSPRARHFIFKQWRVKLGIKLQENYASFLTSASTSLNFSFYARRALSPPAFFGTFVKASFLDEITSNASARP